jgi:stage II sporulation protein AA (anti-sigma F factor antagonist)
VPVRDDSSPPRPAEVTVSLVPESLSVAVALPREGVAVLTVEGPLDLDTAQVFHRYLADQLRNGRRHVLLDMTAVPFMDSSGLNAILRVHQEARGLPGSVHVIAPAPAVRRVLDLTGVSLTLPVSDSVADALALVSRAEETS